MCMYGVRRVALNLIKSYLTDRKQCVVENDDAGNLVKSNWMTVERGVPQGPILGPPIYINHTNDLTQ
ncbi:hypothetical protein HHI36_009336, partial [Cryptolaemus montrouzieri]